MLPPLNTVAHQLAVLVQGHALMRGAGQFINLMFSGVLRDCDGQYLAVLGRQ